MEITPLLFPYSFTLNLISPPRFLGYEMLTRHGCLHKYKVKKSSNFESSFVYSTCGNRSVAQKCNVCKFLQGKKVSCMTPGIVKKNFSLSTAITKGTKKVLKGAASCCSRRQIRFPEIDARKKKWAAIIQTL